MAFSIFVCVRVWRWEVGALAVVGQVLPSALDPSAPRSSNSPGNKQDDKENLHMLRDKVLAQEVELKQLRERVADKEREVRELSVKKQRQYEAARRVKEAMPEAGMSTGAKIAATAKAGPHAHVTLPALRACRHPGSVPRR